MAIEMVNEIVWGKWKKLVKVRMSLFNQIGALDYETRRKGKSVEWVIVVCEPGSERDVPSQRPYTPHSESGNPE